MNPGAAAFIRLVRHPLKFRFFLLTRLPSAYFTGVRVRHIDENRCETSVPYKWLSQNPFRSTYFASLAMAAELSTGALAQAHIYQRQPSVSMLLTSLEATYFRKATGRTIFTCTEGERIARAIDESLASGEGREVKVLSTGTNQQGETVATFYFTWSFKARRT